MLTEKEVLDALFNKQFDVVNEYLKANDINKIFQQGSINGAHGGTLLHYACYIRSLEGVNFLISKGAKTTIESGASTLPNLSRARPIHWLISSANFLPILSPMLETLLSHGTSINDVNQLGRTALALYITEHYAYNTQLLFDVLSLLISKGANVNARQNDGKTPLFLALDRKTTGPTAMAFELELCRFLLDAKAQVCLSVNLGSKTYHNAAEYALDLRKHDCYDLLNTNKEPETSLERQVQKLQELTEALQKRVSALEARSIIKESVVPEDNDEHKMKFF